MRTTWRCDACGARFGECPGHDDGSCPDCPALRAQVEELKAQRTALCAENEEGWDRVDELTLERDAERKRFEEMVPIYNEASRLGRERAEQAETKLKRVEQQRDDRRDEGREQTERAIHFMRRYDEAEAKLARVVEALEQIAKAEGRFSRDPLTHASNTVEDMVALAVAALVATRKSEEGR